MKSIWVAIASALAEDISRHCAPNAERDNIPVQGLLSGLLFEVLMTLWLGEKIKDTFRYKNDIQS